MSQPDGESDTLIRDGVLADTEASDSQPRVDTGSVAIRELAYSERYELGHELGRGGMGEVHACRDRIIGREVALKALLGPRRDRPEAKARFLREARVQGQLEHPSVVPVYDLGVSPEGAVFFTMKRVRGRTLAEHLDARVAGAGDGVSIQQLLLAFGSVCLAVELSHRRGVVHRDLKPSNVMLGDFGEVYVLDWGLAKVLREAESPEERPESVDPMDPADGSGGTRDGALLGTPGYMSPEQARGLEVGPSSDVYALGAILFEILALEPLHRGDRVPELMASTLSAAHDGPAARRPELSVPPELDAICRRATAHDAADRFPTARALHDAVQRYLEGDRDLALRKRLAAEHLSAAREASRRPETRREALAEVGRAIALTPDDDEAIRVLTELLLIPPERTPVEVLRELDDTRAEQYRAGARSTVVMYGLYSVLGAALFLLDVRDPVPLLVAVTLAAVTVATAVAALRAERVTRVHEWVTFVPATLAIVLSSWLTSPLILAPALMAASVMSFGLTPVRRDRWAMALSSGAAWMIPFVLQWTGAVEPFFAVEADRLVIFPRSIMLEPGLSVAVLVVVHLLAMILPAAVGGGIRDNLQAEQLRSRVQAWNVRQLLPDKARRPLGA
jgi:serine/threonine-protein kinase